MRRATFSTFFWLGFHANFYPRSPCGERHFIPVIAWERAAISIHALLAESDVHGLPHADDGGISIHALLAESDKTNGGTTIPYFNFYPRSPCGERQPSSGLNVRSVRFLSTLSLRRATVSYQHVSSDFWDFYPRSPCGERPIVSTFVGKLIYDFYPRSPCGERLPEFWSLLSKAGISIHALLAESDLRVVDGSKSSIISIHALLAESDYDTSSLMKCQVKFLSTLSLRRATLYLCDMVDLVRYFYPRSPCGERRRGGDFCYLDNIISIHALLAESDCFKCSLGNPHKISIHALLAESDIILLLCVSYYKKFLSTLSLRRATFRSSCKGISYFVFLSTLSLRRATANRLRRLSPKLYFYPRSPCGERLNLFRFQRVKFKLFLSTLSLRRATLEAPARAFLISYFYPRSPCGERQFSFQTNNFKLDNFYPRSPCGERLHLLCLLFSSTADFYPRSPCGERPDMAVSYSKGIKISIHALLAESDLIWRYLTPKALKFLSTLSLRRATVSLRCPCYVPHHFYPRSPCGERHSKHSKCSYT